LTGGLRRLLNPESVVVVGAKDAPGNRGGQAMAYLRKFGFAGPVTPVHPSAATVHGYPGVATLTDLDHVPDVALIAVGARNVAPVVADLGRIGVGAAVVWAGGFAENGGPGVELQRQLADAGRDAGVRLLGPNCLGLVNSQLGFAGSFASWLRTVDTVLPGHISMVTQSGGLGAAAHAVAQRSGIGFRYMVSTGNEADIGAVEVLDTFADDPETHVICCYLEGVTDGRGLVAALRKARQNGKDVVVLKGGRSAASARAVAAHTGALAGQARVWDSVLTSVDAVQVYSLEELIEVSTALAGTWGKPAPAGNRVVITSYGGGSGVLAADQCTEAGLTVVPLSGSTREALRPLAPEIASLANPIDLTPEAFNQERYRDKFGLLLKELERSGEVDGFLLQGGAMSVGADTSAREMCEFAKDSGAPVAVYWPDAPAEALAVYQDYGVRVFEHQQPAVATLARVLSARSGSILPAADGIELPALDGIGLPAVSPGQVLGEHLVHDLLRAAGVSTLDGRLATSADEAVIAAAVDGPVALKVVSPQITHRAAAGLVRLGVTGPEAVRAEYTALTEAAKALGADVEGVYVQRMGPPGGTEFLVSAFRDEAFGPVVSIGAGGVFTELLDDVVFALAPLSGDAAAAVLDRLRTARYLRRKGLGDCLGPLSEFVAGLSRLAAALPWPGYVLEVNPVSAGPGYAVALDGLVVIEGGGS
jgi:acetate---CoA ligase (ADP-forming)